MKIIKMKVLAVIAVALCLIACQSVDTGVSGEAIVQDVGDAKNPSTAKAMVVTANPHATKAGEEVLRAGGSAVDAAIAIEAVLSLVEPQSSGLAGGAFLVHYHAATKQVSVYDGRETAPANAHSEMFILPDGNKMGFLNAKNSGLSTGVPGVISMFQLAHEDHGKLAWGPHFDAAKNLAENGFAVSPRLHGMIKRFGKYIPSTDEQGQTTAYQYFHTDDGQPLPVGHLLKNPQYANALEVIAQDPRNFYTGPIAEEIVRTVAIEPRAGSLSLADLANYEAVRRTALCTSYKQLELCGPPPPSSWVGVAMMMGILEKSSPFSKDGANDPANWAMFGEAQRLAYADRDQFVADPSVVMVPLKGMLDKDYLAQRASMISAAKAASKISHGDPWAYNDSLPIPSGKDATGDTPGTTHFVVVDHDGNVVSMTASVESIFGSTRMVGGMFLNNQLTDFSFKSRDQNGQAIANAVAAGKRPRSSMSPTIVLNKNGEFVMATGSPGGNSILAYTAKSLLGVLEWGLSPEQSVALPNLVGRGDKVRIESERASPELVQGLRDYGFEVKESAGENSGLSVVVRHPDGRLEGGADPRREGVVSAIE